MWISDRACREGYAFLGRGRCFWDNGGEGISINDGGAAFPVYEESRFGEDNEFYGKNPTNYNMSGMYCADSGMTLRDWFAGQALGGYCPPGGISYMRQHAGVGYEFGDAQRPAR